jgi:hypothetical protein
VEPLLNVWDYEERAAAPPGPRPVLPAGPATRWLRDNVAAPGRLQPRIARRHLGLHHRRDDGAWGEELSMPLAIAPVAFQRVAHPDGEVGMARAARAAGTVMCLSTLATSTPAEVAAAGSLRWFQLYVFRDDGVTRELVAQARDNGFTALVLTVDTPVLGRRGATSAPASFPPGVGVASLGSGGVTPLEEFALMSPSVTWRDVGASPPRPGCRCS